MKNICFYFQVHQPFRLKRYRFFEIGKDHYYYDDYLNKQILNKVAEHSYLPMNQLILKLIKKYPGQFKVSFSLTGMVLDQMELYAPKVIKSFQKLAQTGQVEFLSETYSHSLAVLQNEQEFVKQVQLHDDKIESLFNQRPKVFRNTELVYSDELGRAVSKMKFRAMLAEGAKHVLGWKSPNYLYYNAMDPKLKVMLRNYKLSDDIAFRFSNQGWSEWPLTAEKYMNWLRGLDPNEEFVNLFMDYETFGEHQKVETGIMKFFEHLVHSLAQDSAFGFMTPSEIATNHQAMAPIQVPYPSSWADEERDLSAWLGNEMQKEAFDKLYALQTLVEKIDDPALITDWKYLQASDHFYYMCTKFFSDGAVHHYFNPYNSPYDAFINYMNVLSDFIIRLENVTNRIKFQGTPIEELAGDQLQDAIQTYSETLKMMRKRRTMLEKQLSKAQPARNDLPELTAKGSKTGSKKR